MDVTAPELTIAVVGYGAPEWLDRLLGSLRGAGRPTRTHEVVLVDNRSPTPLRESLQSSLEDLRLVELEHNVGFASACNLAARLGTGRCVVFVNPDAEVLPGALDALVDFLDEDPRRGLVGGRTISPEGELDPRSCFGDPTAWSEFCFATGLSTAFKDSRIFDRESLGWWARDTPREVGVVTGCLLLADREVYLRLGGLDENFFMYGEDVDLSRRARRAGYRPSITPAATIVHAGGGTSTTISKLIMVMTGKATMYRRGASAPRWWLSRSLLVAGVGLRALQEAATRSPDDRWRTALRRRGEWLRGWVPGDVPPVVIRSDSQAPPTSDHPA